jgi:AcrR family transcriptional regulator
MPRPPDPERRDVLLAAATEHVLERGMAGLSLRPLAKALGTSPRMLLYHFESKERLVTEILAAAREHQARLTAAWVAEQPDLEAAELLRRFWRWQVEEHRPFLRLFFEVYGLALQDPQRFPGFPRDAVVAWFPLLTTTLEAAGVPKRRTKVVAGLVVATYRGLLLDVLATGDVRRTSAALDLFLEALDQYFAASAAGAPR